MTIKEVERLLKEYSRLNEKIFGFNQSIRRCQEEKIDSLALYPQMSENSVRISPTNSISDPTYKAVSRAITIYDKEIEKLAEEMRICAYKKDIVDAMLGQITVEECDAIDYFYFRGLRPIHIASKLCMSESTFFRTKKRALKKMSDYGSELER